MTDNQLKSDELSSAVFHVVGSGGRMNWHDVYVHLRELYPSLSTADLSEVVDRAYKEAKDAIEDNPMAGLPLSMFDNVG